jgi:mannose-6-phosphate isomerase
MLNQSNSTSAGSKKLRPRLVEKPWGRDQLPPIFEPASGKRIGEIWFEGGEDLPLLAKYLFTSEKLSVQVHPDDDQARARAHARGKSECWYVLDAQAGASIGLGLRREVTRDQLRAAALDGSIEELLHWREVAAGDFFLITPGTIHAIGGGISLLEFQQNSDVTYRLYDYGRPRELHLDDAVAVARLEPYPEELFRRIDPAEESILVDGPPFTLVHAHGDRLQDRQRWILPLEGNGRRGDDIAGPGECLLVGKGETVETDRARLLIGAVAG